MGKSQEITSRRDLPGRKFFASMLVLLAATLACKGGANQATDLAMDRFHDIGDMPQEPGFEEAEKGDGGVVSTDYFESVAVDPSDLGGFDEALPEKTDSQDVEPASLPDHGENADDGTLGEWAIGLAACDASFSACDFDPPYLRDEAHLRVDVVEGDAPKPCHVIIEGDGQTLGECDGLPCDADVVFDKTVKSVHLTALALCSGEARNADVTLPVFAIWNKKIRPCIAWGEWSLETVELYDLHPLETIEWWMDTYDRFHVFGLDVKVIRYLVKDGPTLFDEPIKPSFPVYYGPPVTQQFGVAMAPGGPHVVVLGATDGPPYHYYHIHRGAEYPDWVFDEMVATMPLGYLNSSLAADEDGTLYAMLSDVGLPGECEAFQPENMQSICEDPKCTYTGVCLVLARKAPSETWTGYPTPEGLSSGLKPAFRLWDLAGPGVAGFFAQIEGPHLATFFHVVGDSFEASPIENLGSYHKRWLEPWFGMYASPDESALSIIGVLQDYNAHTREIVRYHWRPGENAVLETTPLMGILEDLFEKVSFWPRPRVNPVVMDSLGRVTFVMRIDAQDKPRFVFVSEYPSERHPNWTVEPLVFPEGGPGVYEIPIGMDSRARIRMLTLGRSPLMTPQVHLWTRSCVKQLPEE